MAILGNLFYPATDGRQLNLEGMVIFIAAGFFSILIHELGHAFSMRKHGGRDIQIQLQGLGGQAAYRPDPERPITRWKSIAISAAGPLYQLIAGIAAKLFLIAYSSTVGDATMLVIALEPFILISILWGAFNLLVPIFPLDGGQILNGILGPKNIKTTLWIGLILCIVLAILMSIRQLSFWNLLIIGLLASQNIRMLQAIREQEKGGPTPPPQP